METKVIIDPIGFNGYDFNFFLSIINFNDTVRIVQILVCSKTIMSLILSQTEFRVNYIDDDVFRLVLLVI